MNNTNRGLNRFGIFLFGLILLVAGAAVAIATAIPEWLDQWKSVSGTIDDGSADVISNTTVDGLGQSWLLIAIPVVCLLLVVLLLVFIFRQGQGHTRTLVTEKVAADPATSTGGSVIIDGKVAEQAIQQALASHPGLLSSSVSTYTVGRTPTLSISTTLRRGVSPYDVRVFIDDTVAAWDGILGREVPVFIQINAGIASRMAKTTRVTSPAIE